MHFTRYHHTSSPHTNSRDPSSTPPLPSHPRCPPDPCPPPSRRAADIGMPDLLLDELQRAILNQIGHVVVLRGVPSGPLVVEPVGIKVPFQVFLGGGAGRGGRARGNRGESIGIGIAKNCISIQNTKNSMVHWREREGGQPEHRSCVTRIKEYPSDFEKRKTAGVVMRGRWSWGPARARLLCLGPNQSQRIPLICAAEDEEPVPSG